MDASISRTDVNLWVAFADEAKAQRLYAAYAQAALDEGYPAIAETFMEAAGSEAVHAMALLRALGAVKSTAENLRRVISEEANESENNYPRYIREAEVEGRSDAIAAFQLALNRERHHVTVFQNALDSIERAGAAAAPNGPAVAPRAGVGQQPPRVQAGFEKLHGPAESKSERERIASRSRIREVVFGAQDGVLTTVGVVSAFFGATHRNSEILLAGLASGFAGMIAMSAGSYMSTKAEAEVGQSEIEREAREIEEHPAEELAELIEIYRQQGLSMQRARETAAEVVKDPRRLLRVMAREELGLDVEPQDSPIKNAGVMALSFLGGAIFPILPYTVLHGLIAFWTSILLAGAVLFGVGVVKARVADTNPWRSGLEIFAIGAAAGLLAYVLGTLIPSHFGVTFTG
ncbi:MAG: VIT1/CCC1 transporter family protein [Candidatus Eremiobacteraeota bacterium]|nr:VIT1/CCC1 transporter family protein [Candidatus Eremiobacteraeota bacterium]